MRPTIYFDTSALAKWYLNEAKSDEVEKYIQENGPAAISEITLVEMRSLLARRRREGNINAHLEMKVFATFEEDIRRSYLVCHPLPKGLAAGAVNLLATYPEIPLRTLDALHLVICLEIPAQVLAAADRVMIAGGKAAGLSVVRFDESDPQDRKK